jgi:hypothetical protein
MVALTKERIQKMKEAELRKEVLLPLLEAMGYHHVFEHHGSRELGKDFICWKNDDIGSRKNLALVVKAVPLTGQAKKAAGSTTEVQTQIQECFGKRFLDPVTGEEQIVHHCWVVSNQEISTGAIDALTASLSPSGVNRDVSYIDGDRLWKLIEQYLPVRAIFQKLGEVSQVLDSLDTHSSLQVHLANSGIQMSVAEKFPGAWQEKPFFVRPVFEFPDAPEGRAAKDALEQALATGAPLNIPAAFIKHVEFPEFMSQLVEDVQSLQFGAVQNPIPVPFRIEIQSTDGEKITLECVYLKITQIGLDEMTFVSDEKLTPLPLRMTLRMPAPHRKETARITFSQGLDKANPYQLMQLLQLQLCLSKGFVVTLTDLKTGIVFCQLSYATGAMDAPGLQDMELIRDLAAIQVKAGIVLMLPEQGFTREDDEALVRLRTILHENGRVEKTWSNCYPYFPLEQAKKFYEEFKDGNIHQLVIQREEAETFLGMQLPLGLVETKLHRAKLINEQEVYAQIQHAETAQTPILFKFEPADSDDACSTYLKWTSDTE